MKKILRNNLSSRYYVWLSKILKVMKITLLLLILGLSNICASVYSQSLKIDLNLKNVTLKEAFANIERQTNYKFLFRPDLINVDKLTNLENSGTTNINELLTKLLKDSKIGYDVINNNLIVLSPLQKRKITGTVTDATTGESLPGVSIMIEGTKKGTVTGIDGKFAFELSSANDVLVFSFIGYETQKISTFGKSTIVVQLKNDVKKLDEVVVVGYGTQKKTTVTGSVASVRGETISIAPLASTTNTLAGQLPGLISLQSSGQPGADAAALSIRGFGSALAIVDGVEADFNAIDPNSIESISILKDGAASIYGARAGNGVILVTTKRGLNEKPTITLNSSYTLQGITIMPKPASSGQYAEMTSETWLQSGKPASTVPYTPEQIQKYYAGTDPLYPNTNWYNELVRDWAPQQQHNLSIRGGSDKIKYYGFIGYLDQGSMWKNNGGDYSRYNVQSNIDAKVTNNLSLQLDISSIVESNKSTWRPQSVGGGIWQDFWNTLPIYPATLPDATKISFANGSGTGGAQVTSNRSIAGYTNTDNQNLKGTISLNYNIRAVKGLSAKALINVIQDYRTNKIFNKPVNFYTYDPDSKIYTLAGSLGSQASLSEDKYSYRNITSQFSLNYDHVFNEDHHITALGLYEAIDYYSDDLSAGRVNFLTPSIDQLFGGSTTGMYNNGSASEMGRKSYVGRLNYSFKNKYLIETTIRADASAKFPSNKRWGYFPSVSLGWVMSDEYFMKGLGEIDNLKLRASYGESGNDNVGNFQYLTGYQYGSTYPFGGIAQQGLVSTGLANPYLTWERIKIYNTGLDFSLFKHKLYGLADVFYRERSGIPATLITTLPSTFGSNLPPENINSLNDRGFEFNLGTSGTIGELKYDVSGNISWSRSKWDHYEEPVYTDQDQARIYKQSGRWTDRAYGYLSDGLFTSQSQIDALKFDEDGQGNKSLRPGDIRYVDVNGDGKLDWKDQVEIGKGTTPHWMLGVNTSLKYKNFDFSCLFQGAFGYYNSIVLQHGLLYPEIMYNLRWTSTNNNANALVPRLGGAATNGLSSDYYYKKAGYLRLKVLNLGYNLPKNMLEKINIKQVRIYLAGTNLLTFDKLSKYDIDPEAPSGNAGCYYPQQRTITLGVNLSF